MKKLLICIISLSILILQSCTVALPLVQNQVTKKDRVTHSDVMKRYMIKLDVIKGFGIPNIKDKIDGIEIWYYDLGLTTTSSSYVSGRRNTDVNPNNYSGVNENTKAVTKTSLSNKYVEFQFIGDDVVNWRTKGVHYGDRLNLWPVLVGACMDGVILGIWLGSYTGSDPFYSSY